MILYTCPAAESGAPVHPCGRAAKALSAAGHTYEHRTVAGGSLKPWTWPTRSRDRAEIVRLSGQRAVPILVLDGGEVISGSGTIARWAAANPPAAGSDPAS